MVKLGVDCSCLVSQSDIHLPFIIYVTIHLQSYEYCKQSCNIRQIIEIKVTK